MRKKPVPMPLSRPPLERMQRLHQLLHAGGYPNAVSLSVELEVTTKTVYRDVEFMRERLGLPIAFDVGRNGYHYTEEVAAFPTFQITEGELFALIVAEKALQQYRGTSFEKPLLSAIRKMEQALPDTISLNLADVEQTISFRTTAEPVVNLGVFEALAKATAARRQLEFSYRKPGQSSPDRRVVDPYHLANINGEWFLFAFDHGRRDVRTFAPARISEVRETGGSFVRSQKFSLEKRLRDSFGVHSAEGEFDVCIRFDASIADYIREKRWHASQISRELAEGGLEVRMKLSSLAEVERWVLAWAGRAVVLQPRELVASVREGARRLAERHGHDEEGKRKKEKGKR
ncbi:MAG: WYL domain-containing transcriptional regulator [Verrucomicrobia bacterium]|nr:WYL domain-containing transcriptional regulator [Verrucomicrobiota bacterium]